MKLVWHIFKKDLRHSWWGALGVIAVLLWPVWRLWTLSPEVVLHSGSGERRSAPPGLSDGPSFMVFYFILYLLHQVCREETYRRYGWLLPLSRWTVWRAKMLFFLLIIALPMGIGMVAMLLAQGASGPEAFRALISAAMVWLPTVGGVLAFILTPGGARLPLGVGLIVGAVAFIGIEHVADFKVPRAVLFAELIMSPWASQATWGHAIVAMIACVTAGGVMILATLRRLRPWWVFLGALGLVVIVETTALGIRESVRARTATEAVAAVPFAGNDPPVGPVILRTSGSGISARVLLPSQTLDAGQYVEWHADGPAVLEMASGERIELNPGPTKDLVPSWNRLRLEAALQVAPHLKRPLVSENPSPNSWRRESVEELYRAKKINALLSGEGRLRLPVRGQLWQLRRQLSEPIGVGQGLEQHRQHWLAVDGREGKKKCSAVIGRTWLRHAMAPGLYPTESHPNEHWLAALSLGHGAGCKLSMVTREDAWAGPGGVRADLFCVRVLESFAPPGKTEMEGATLDLFKVVPSGTISRTLEVPAFVAAPSIGPIFPFDASPGRMPSLPDPATASAEEIANYLSFCPSTDTDQSPLIAAYVPKQLPVVLEFIRKIEPPTRSYRVFTHAVTLGALETQRDEILRWLPHVPALSEVVLARGWMKEAAPALLEMVLKSYTLGPEAVQAAGALQDPALYPRLIAELEHTQQLETYSVLHNLAGIEPSLSQAVRRLWQKRTAWAGSEEERLDQNEEQRDPFGIALCHGLPEAFAEALNQCAEAQHRDFESLSLLKRFRHCLAAPFPSGDLKLLQGWIGALSTCSPKAFTFDHTRRQWIANAETTAKLQATLQMP